MNLPKAGAAPFLYLTYREGGRMFQDIALWRSGTVSVTGLAEPEEVRSLDVTQGLLPLLAVQPALGRWFSQADDAPGSPETVILTAGYWRSKFGGDPSVIGRRILLDSRAREIIGVLPDTFRFLDRKPAVVVPLRLDRTTTFLGNFSYSALARLKPGGTIQQANADHAVTGEYDMYRLDDEQQRVVANATAVADAHIRPHAANVDQHAAFPSQSIAALGECDCLA